ncbi:hypothetical protein AB0N37_00665 [Streptomyces griseoincarnatus]|uniref:DUF2092 domain-containing protein n=2 Tax=Streptomyces TaxID=1883 RepID=A0ABP7XYR1_9ACTN|nr:hypothetical protein [Streptomyces sp. HNS054]WPW21971.1 hypothetical protein UBV09_26290 [Streptomyces griseoincarnatus]
MRVSSGELTFAIQPFELLGRLTRRPDRSLDKEIVIFALRKTLTTTAVAGMVLAGTAACGTVENLSAGQKLDNAFDKLGEERSIAFELDLDTDAKSLMALDAEQSEPGEEMPAEIAELLSEGTISVSMHSKKPIEKSEDKDFTAFVMTVNGPDGALLEYRLIGDWFYARVDASTFGRIAGVPMPLASELPEGPFRKLLEGEWIQVSKKEMEENGKGIPGAPGFGGEEPSAGPSLDAGTQKKLTDALKKVVAENVDFTTSGGSDGTEHIKATAPFRTLLTELFGALKPLQNDLPVGDELPTAKDLADAPNKKVSADFTLKNGELTEVSVDLARLAETAKVKKFALVLRVSEGEKPEAPAGATKVTLEDLMGGFFTGVVGEGLGEEFGDVPLEEGDLENDVTMW